MRYRSLTGYTTEQMLSIENCKQNLNANAVHMESMPLSRNARSKTLALAAGLERTHAVHNQRTVRETRAMKGREGNGRAMGVQREGREGRNGGQPEVSEGNERAMRRR
jgi:hypothetical protein